MAGFNKLMGALNIRISLGVLNIFVEVENGTLQVGWKRHPTMRRR